jgi:DNA-binding MarR family transcriptional regulator
MLKKQGNSHRGLGQNPNLVVNPADYFDTTFQAYSERVGDDYTFILKRAVIPGLGNIGALKLRELRILASLDFFDRPLTPVQVSEMLRYDPATVTRATRLLCNAGMMIRADNLKDTRSVLLIPTEKGKALAHTYRERIQEVFGAFEQDLNQPFRDSEKLEYLNMVVKANKRSAAMRQLCLERKWT